MKNIGFYIVSPIGKVLINTHICFSGLSMCFCLRRMRASNVWTIKCISLAAFVSRAHALLFTFSSWRNIRDFITVME